MDRYVGLDAHAQTCTLTVLGPTGKRLTSRVVETNALRAAICEIPGRIHLCLEEGTQSAWLYEILEPQVSEIVVAMPEETNGAKDDLRDAWARADELRTGRIRTKVYKAPTHLTTLRSAACAYRMATQDVVRVKNRLKSVLRSRGILAERRRLVNGMKPNLATLTLARRIAAIVLSRWKHEEVYDQARLKVVTDARLYLVAARS
jgi:hypothetical protein